MKKIKLIITLVIIAIVVAAGLYVAYKYTHLFDSLKRKPLAIEKTANVVEEVKKIGEFTTACYYEEVALHEKYSKRSALVFSSNNEIILIGKGRVRAGFDLSKIGENDLIVRDDTLRIALPQPEIFDIIMNPSDFATEYEKGTWSHELLKPVKVRAKTKLEQNAIKYGILQKAEENGLKRLEALFMTFGFNAVILTVNQPTEETTAEES